MINTQALKDALSKHAPHVDKQRREDWLQEAISICSYNADMTKSFADSDKRNAFIEELVTKDIKRLGSFGGNDIAAFWLDYNDIFSPFTNDEGLPQNTQSVIESKLCIIAPTRMTGDMIRGVALEDCAKRDFERQMVPYGFTPRPDMLEIFSSLYDKRIPEHPWLVGMPDGIYEDRNGDIHVVDFKVPANPSSIKNMQKDPPAGYNAQMGTYEAILNYHNINVKSRILAPLSVKTMEVSPIIMPEVENFTKILLDLGDQAWSHVLNGTIPHKDYDFSNVERVEKVHPDVEAAANKFCYLNTIKNLSSKAADEARSDLEWSLKKHHDIEPSGHKKVKLPVGISYSTTDEKKELSKDALIRKYQDMGGDINDPDLYLTKSASTKINVSKAKRDPYTPRLDQIRSLASEIIGESIEELNDIIGVDDARNEPSDYNPEKEEEFSP